MVACGCGIFWARLSPKLLDNRIEMSREDRRGKLHGSETEEELGRC
jgi:hypothetical protein